MVEQDGLKAFKFKDGGGSDLYTKIKEGDPQKLRVLTLDPVVHIDNYGNTRYAFVVYNYTQGKAQILDRGTSIAKALAELHNDEDYGALNKIDIKISATGEGKETRYAVNVLPKTEVLTTDQIKECAAITLPEGTRMSEINEGAAMPVIQVDPEYTDEDAPIDLESIGF